MKLTELLRKKNKVHLSVKKVEASRVVYESEEIQRMEIRMELPTDEQLILELTMNQARELANHLVVSLQAAGYEFKVRR